MTELRIYMGGPTSLPTAGFASAGLASMGLVAHGAEPRPHPRAGLVTVSSLAQAATFSVPTSSTDFYDDIAYTDVIWPTGMGWTAGAESTILANIQALINSSGSGSGLLSNGLYHYRRHRPAPGAVYPINNGIDLSLKNYLIFEGGGSEVDQGTDVTVGGVTRRRITNTGHSGGATIRTSGSPSASPSGRGSAFYSQRSSSLPAAIDIRMHCLTIEGSSTNYATTSAGNGGERQHGIHMAGWDGCWIDHCIFDKNKGDGIYLTDSYGGNQNGFRSRNVRITNTRLRRNGRMLVANVHGTGLTIEDCLFEDACYAHVDIEPNHSWATCGDLRVARCTFGDWGWDPDFYGSPLLMTAAEDGVIHEGYIQWIDNVHVGLSKTTGRPAEWNSDVTMAPYSVYTKTGPLTMTGNIRIAGSKPGPAIYLSRNSGGSTVTNNKGFLTSGSFVGGSAGGSVTQSGNT